MQLFLRHAAAIAAGLLVPVLAQAQFTETFEGININPSDTLAKPTSFTNNGRTFNLITGNCAVGGTFGVFIPGQWVQPCNGGTLGNNNQNSYGAGTSCSGGTCTGSSPKFIDNTGIGFGGNYANSQIFTIKTANSVLFTMKTLFLYLSADRGVTPSAGGGVTFRGKVNGNTVFTFVKTTGFNTSFSTNNGFTYIDFGAYNTTNIDELEIQGGASTNYVGIDNFTFGALVPLPVTLTSFAAVPESGMARLNWTTAAETNFAYYEVERSDDGSSFAAIGRQQGKGKGMYQYYDRTPLAGNSWYRLRMVDVDGQVAYSGVAAFTAGSQAAGAAYLYPNPAKASVKVMLNGRYTGAQLLILDATGRLLRQQTVGQDGQEIPVPGMTAGFYLYRITTAEGNVLGQGKLQLQ